jgi:hypothetical protein
MTDGEEFFVHGADGVDYPCDLETLRAWARQARVTSDQQIFVRRTETWQMAHAIPELRGYLVPPVRAAGATPPAPAASVSSGTGCAVVVAIALIGVLVSLLAGDTFSVFGILGLVLFAVAIVLAVVWIAQNANMRVG